MSGVLGIYRFSRVRRALCLLGFFVVSGYSSGETSEAISPAATAAMVQQSYTMRAPHPFNDVKIEIDYEKRNGDVSPHPQRISIRTAVGSFNLNANILIDLDHLSEPEITFMPTATRGVDHYDLETATLVIRFDFGLPYRVDYCKELPYCTLANRFGTIRRTFVIEVDKSNRFSIHNTAPASELRVPNTAIPST